VYLYSIKNRCNNLFEGLQGLFGNADAGGNVHVVGEETCPNWQKNTTQVQLNYLWCREKLMLISQGDE